jgi:hypothetical protein
MFARLTPLRVAGTPDFRWASPIDETNLFGSVRFCPSLPTDGEFGPAGRPKGKSHIPAELHIGGGP